MLKIVCKGTTNASHSQRIVVEKQIHNYLIISISSGFHLKGQNKRRL